ncbi:hypothetical protein ACFC4C_19670 [Streptomyces sp. NPDC056039]|uniref:hypothetical protein n=1 Tax=Streptomyces sp. NPDC056039 TaxID=3345687 RepID=UPI0035D5CDFD
MTTKTTFEDRLLAELQREVEVRGAGGPAGAVTGPTEAVTGPAGAVAARRSPFAAVLTGRRLALAAGACAVTGLVLVLVPGSPGESPAYAVERHGDGSVTLTLTEIEIGPDAQRRLAERLRAEGIHVTIDNLSFGQSCKQPRGQVLDSSVVRAFIGDKPYEGGSVPAEPTDPAFHRNWQVTLRPGDSVGMENTSRKDGQPGRSSEAFYAFKGKIAPCEPESLG